MNVLISPQPSMFPHRHENPRQSPQRSLSPLHTMTNRKRKADDDDDDDGDDSMSPRNSPTIASRPLARPSKKVRSNDLAGRPLPLPRLLETLESSQLRLVLERICERHPDIGTEVAAGAPRPTVSAALEVLTEYQNKLKDAIPYGQSSPEYTYYRVKDALVAMLDALFDFAPQFLPPNELQPTKSLEFLDGATKLIHQLPDWEPQAYRHHKDNAYEEISKAWTMVINEAEKRGGGFNLHTSGWDQKAMRHNTQSGGRLASAVSAIASTGWMETGQTGNSSEGDSILNQIMSGQYSAPVRVGSW